MTRPEVYAQNKKRNCADKTLESTSVFAHLADIIVQLPSIPRERQDKTVLTQELATDLGDIPDLVFKDSSVILLV